MCEYQYKAAWVRYRMTGCILLMSTYFPNFHLRSKRIPFGRYLCKLMTSWALVCDVWFLEPQVRRGGRGA